MKSTHISRQFLPLCVVGGSAHPKLAQDTANEMGISLGGIEHKRFPNSEVYVRYTESVRGCHVVIIQSLVATDNFSVNDALVELILMIDAAKRASASEITVVMPYMAYSRQDRKAKGREPVSAAAVIRMLESAGADRLVSIDIHSPQTQAVFNGPFDHLVAEGIIRSALKHHIESNPIDEFTVVSPDGGRAKIAEHYAEYLGIEVFHMPKSRSRDDSSIILRPDSIDGVKGKSCLLVDDMIDTAGTLVSAAKTLKESGAEKIIIAATHALLSDPALERLKASPIDIIFATDITPLERPRKILGSRIKILSIAPLLATSLAAIVSDNSVSDIFQGRNYL